MGRTGITSSSAGGLTGLSVVQDGSDVLVKYGFNGDINVDGRINADDYFRIDSGFLDQPQIPLYTNGDFNFDDRINADDYFLIDSAFLGQGQPAVAATDSVAAITAITQPREIAAETSDQRRKTLRRRRNHP